MFDWDKAAEEVRAERGDDQLERYGWNLLEQAKRLMGDWTDDDETAAQSRAQRRQATGCDESTPADDGC